MLCPEWRQLRFPGRKLQPPVTGQILQDCRENDGKGLKPTLSSLPGHLPIMDFKRMNVFWYGTVIVAYVALPRV